MINRFVLLPDDHPIQPQPARDSHGHRMPQTAADRLDPQFIGLDVLQVDLPLLNKVLLYLLAVLSGPLQPGGHGPLVQRNVCSTAWTGQPQ